MKQDNIITIGSFVYVGWKDGVLKCKVTDVLNNNILEISVLGKTKFVESHEVSIHAKSFDGMVKFGWS